jgi:hypothetical protein
MIAMSGDNVQTVTIGRDLNAAGAQWTLQGDQRSRTRLDPTQRRVEAVLAGRDRDSAFELEMIARL